jgi:ribonuclease HI
MVVAIIHKRTKQISHQSSPAIDLAVPTHKLFLSVAGSKKSPFHAAQHVYAWRLFKIDGEMIASNDKASPVLTDGSDNLGLYSAILEALAYLPKSSTVQMFAPQEELLHVFSEGLDSLEHRDFRKRDKKPYVHRDQIKAVDALARESDVELLALKPHLSDEFENLGGIGDLARDRLREAVAQDAHG